MKLLFVRHGDPDYERDTLTEKGWKEAGYLAEWMEKIHVDEFYVSPLGRAQDTASLTLKRMNRTAKTLEWLQEFSPRVLHPHNMEKPTIAWDWLPADWMTQPFFYQKDQWYHHPYFEAAGVEEEYKRVTGEFDRFLTEHGYVRGLPATQSAEITSNVDITTGAAYQAVHPNSDTIVFFCHLGLECVLMSHLLDISPMILWHGFAPAPTSVTWVNTEERRPGIASFRIARMGDISHLNMREEQPSFSARFRECYTHENERRD